jgi:hypothetical protein
MNTDIWIRNEKRKKVYARYMNVLSRKLQYVFDFCAHQVDRLYTCRTASTELTHACDVIHLLGWIY